MKSFKMVFALLVLSVAVFAQTKDLGLGAFANDKDPIMLAVDAGVASWNLRSPYVMFVVSWPSKDQKQDIAVNRKGVTLVYNGQEYQMPPLKELRKNYGGEDPGHRPSPAPGKGGHRLVLGEVLQITPTRAISFPL